MFKNDGGIPIKPTHSATNFVRVCRTEEIPEGDAVLFAIDGRQIAIFKSGASFFACLDICPHWGVSLADGDFAEGCLTCPLHDWRFDLRDGSRVDDRDDKCNRLQTFKVKVEGDQVFIALPQRLETDLVRIEDIFAIGTVGDFPVGHVAVFEVQQRHILIVNDDGTIYAVDGNCPHMDASLAEGQFRNGTVQCPMHDWVFSLKDGKRLGSSSPRRGEQIGTYVVLIEEEQLFVRIPRNVNRTVIEPKQFTDASVRRLLDQLNNGGFPLLFDSATPSENGVSPQRNSQKEEAFRIRKYRKRGRHPSLFLSHSSQDRVFVRHLTNRLTRVGIDVIVDEAALKVGDSLISRIGEIIDVADFVGVVLSNNSINSRWVQKEISLAMSREVSDNKMIVLPILIDDCPIPDFIKDKVYADFRDRKNFFPAFDRLLKALGYTGTWNWYFDDYRYRSRIPCRHEQITQQFGGRTPRVMAFWHDVGFTKQDAADMVCVLGDIFTQCDIYRHRKPEGPDAIFISRDAPRIVVANVLDALPYDVKYVFPLDYADPDCGALSEIVVSVGLRSDTRSDLHGKSEMPIRLTKEMMQELRTEAHKMDPLYTSEWCGIL